MSHCFAGEAEINPTQAPFIFTPQKTPFYDVRRALFRQAPVLKLQDVQLTE